MIPDRKLTERFTLYDMTRTDKLEFQGKNREITEAQIEKLYQVAKLLEHVVFVLAAPVIVTSAYRCPELNKAVGSTNRSQHLLCEAVDFVPTGHDIGSDFRAMWRDIKDKGTNVGQLIHETAKRNDRFSSWIHISLGSPYRDKSRNGQILRMESGKYTRLA